ncbi:peptide chain release factor N(5)-glutamine methyltransferase [Sphingobium algorifonticola]|uniref:Release factor glutamine methyltransferase n=1 Tax=Sphingobium algorifonticola TaxID=2008318 RepID=A0A437J3C8_9SPHN|nr:peptide chain release factor N(5)-glutamine methyltransferase [Sphingobium algorifonticola]RVT38885.1 peptide chain release factor N(5)-glutamine methyltransferase [Sphingobium algorifonticola]
MLAPEALRLAAIRLTPVSGTPRLDAELLLAHALEIDRSDLLLKLRDLTAPATFDPLVARRARGEPIAHITGTRDFWTLSLRVTPDVLIPRPDSETLIEAAIDHFRDRPPPTHILDLGTGSGALLLAALDIWCDATGLGVDASQAALAVAQDNARRTGLAARADFRVGDWGAGIGDRFDLILANPPYVSTAAQLPRDVLDHEPHQALFAGADGLDDYRRIAPQLPGLLAADGFAAIEIGFDQGESAAALFREAGFDVTVRRDIAGQDRCLQIHHA